MNLHSIKQCNTPYSGTVISYVTLTSLDRYENNGRYLLLRLIVYRHQGVYVVHVLSSLDTLQTRRDGCPFLQYKVAVFASFPFRITQPNPSRPRSMSRRAGSRFLFPWSFTTPPTARVLIVLGSFIVCSLVSLSAALMGREPIGARPDMHLWAPFWEEIVSKVPSCQNHLK